MTTTEIVKAGSLDVPGAGAALHWRNLKAFWNWCTKSPRGWCTKEVFDAVEARVPGIVFQPAEWIEADKLIPIPYNKKPLTRFPP